MAMASYPQPPELLSMVALVKTLTNAQLKDILRNEGLAVSGVKASLQLRIIECVLNPLYLPSYRLHLFGRFPRGKPRSSNSLHVKKC
ncbi:E3 SUMO-protein ligase pli1 [Aspergillus melleus]|uniref:E3 SUMO-protein ligase pli1 n=1 Tax=Aspergillus melleus TaxID=138277 RepID=A0ACC3BGD7_9EURO|nr:E3 SUMO-protein ligase pli1 [Aspergillus melleus]